MKFGFEGPGPSRSVEQQNADVLAELEKRTKQIELKNAANDNDPALSETAEIGDPAPDLGETVRRLEERRAA